MTTTCIKALYDIPDAYIKDSVNQLGLYEAGDIYSQEDLNSFFAKYAPNVPQGTHPHLDSVDGGEAPVSPGSQYNTGESDIDIDIGFALIYVSSLKIDNKTKILTRLSPKPSHSIKSTTISKPRQTADLIPSSTPSMALIATTPPTESQATLQVSTQHIPTLPQVDIKGH